MRIHCGYQGFADDIMTSVEGAARSNGKSAGEFNTSHSPFQFDDVQEIRENVVIRDIKNFMSDWEGYDYNPRRFIGYLTFAVNYLMGGLITRGYHVVNLATPTLVLV